MLVGFAMETREGVMGREGRTFMSKPESDISFCVEDCAGVEHAPADEYDVSWRVEGGWTCNLLLYGFTVRRSWLISPVAIAVIIRRRT